MTLTRRRLLKNSASTAITLAALGVSVVFTNAASEGPFFATNLLPEIYMGDDNASVTLTEYASMTCPHCKRFHEEVMPKIKKKFIDTGKARYALREFAFDPRASAAFMLARCSPKQNYYPMIDMLFASQDDWARSKTPVKTLLKLSKRGGFTEETFKACLTNRALLGNLNAIKERGEKDFGVRAVPTLFINGVRFEEPLSVENVTRAIEKAMV
ncbi:MAG: DsbA family protein [Rhizobiaceae bacterium]